VLGELGQDPGPVPEPCAYPVDPFWGRFDVDIRREDLWALVEAGISPADQLAELRTVRKNPVGLEWP